MKKVDVFLANRERSYFGKLERLVDWVDGEDFEEEGGLRETEAVWRSNHVMMLPVQDGFCIERWEREERI